MTDKIHPLKMFKDDPNFYIEGSLGFIRVRDDMCGTCKHFIWEPSEKTHYHRACEIGVNHHVEWDTKICESNYERIKVKKKIPAYGPCNYYELVVE